MATTYSTKATNVPYANPTQSATGTLERTVADQVRELTPAAAPVMALVERATVGENGELKRNKGMIKKVGVRTMKHEWNTYTPLGITFTATANGVSSAVGLRLNDVVIDTDTMAVGIADAITYGSGAVTWTTIGSTSFSPAVGSTLLLLADAYKEGSSSPEVVMKDFDNNYNMCQRVRYPVYITDEAKNSPHYVGNIFQRMKKYNMNHAMRMIEHTFLMGERGATGDGTTTTSNLGSVPTMRGLWNWGATSFACGGSMTYEKFFKDLALDLPTTIDDNEDLIMLCGRNIYATMLSWQQDKFLLTESGAFDMFGVKSKKFLTAGPAIEVVKSSAFDQTGMTDKAIIFNAKDIDYVYLEGEDIHPKNNMQGTSELAQLDDITGVISMRCWSGGANVKKITGWAA